MKKFLFGILGLLFAMPAVADLDPCRNLFNKDNITPIAGYIAATGTTWTGNSNGYSLRIPCKPNTKYTARYNGNSTQTVLSFGSTSTNDIPVGNGTVTITQAIRQNNPTISTPITITTGANDKWLIVAYNKAEQQNTDMANNLQIEEGDTATEYVPFCANQIKIATTAYNAARFSPVVTDLNTTIATIRSVVTNTINQTKAIADLQAKKQTRPDENCPAGKKCLLVEDNDGQPHWYEIIESASRLPAGYTELEYIESTGTQEIDTGVLPSAVDDIYVRFKNTTTDAGYLIGAAGGNQYNYVGIHQAFSGYGENWGGSSQYTGFSVPADTSNIHVIKVDLTSAPKFYLDSTLKATQGAYATITSTYTLRVNANVYGDSKRCSARYYDVKLSKNGSLVRDFVPAKNSSGVVGMYDTVSGQFFTNAGSGTFVAGPEI